MVTRINLRVHTTAPSTKKDDEKFKAQAEAYGSFVASNRFTGIHQNGSPTTKADAPSLPQPDMMTINMTPEHGVEKGAPKHQIGDLSNIPYDPTTFLEETQLGYTALESQLFVAPSRILRETSRISLHPTANNIDGSGELENQGSRASRSGEEASSSSHGVPSQSSYLKSPILDRSNKKPRINEENRQYFHTRRSLLPSLIPSREVDTQAAGAISNAAGKKHASSSPRQQQSSNPLQNSIPGDDVTSELPSSYSLSNTTSSNSKDRRQSIRSLSDPGPSPIKAIDPTLAIQVHTPAPSKTSPLNQPVGAAPEKAADSSVPLIRPNSDTAVKDFANVGPVHAESEANTPQALIYPDLPTSIRPPGPTPSLQPFKTHITESLRYLGENPNLAQCYKPVFVSRDLKQSERGCWTFDMTSWPSQLRIEFLQFLIKMIEPGRVGWGVWYVRELGSLEVRVFCWGEVVRHIYLMLYVASKSKVRKLGLKWVDADGVAVVQMRGSEGTGGREKT